MRRITSKLGLALLALALPNLALPCSAWAQESDADLRRDIEELKRGQQHIQQQLQEIRKLIATRPAAPARPAGPDVRGKEFDLADNAVEGELSARLTLVEFTDYQ